MKIKLTISIPNWLDRIFAWPVLFYRKRKFGSAFRKIHLTEGKYALVDPGDFYWLNSFDWFTKKNSKSFYAVRMDNESAKWGKIVTMHRQIMGFPEGFVVDHRNLFGLDNRRSNLRIATRSQNNCNKIQDKIGCTSKYRGVHWVKMDKRWRAHIQFQGKFISLGYFKNEIAAARAYDEAARKYHGEFARLNFP
ncbi:MAG: HNH endonuclease [Sedimentisphaerales bacterium]